MSTSWPQIFVLLILISFTDHRRNTRAVKWQSVVSEGANAVAVGHGKEQISHNGVSSERGFCGSFCDAHDCGRWRKLGSNVLLPPCHDAQRRKNEREGIIHIVIPRNDNAGATTHPSTILNSHSTSCSFTSFSSPFFGQPFFGWVHNIILSTLCSSVH